MTVTHAVLHNGRKHSCCATPHYMAVSVECYQYKLMSIQVLQHLLQRHEHVLHTVLQAGPYGKYPSVMLNMLLVMFHTRMAQSLSP